MQPTTLVAAVSFEQVLEYVGVLLVFGFGIIILVKIATNQININKLLEESGGGASMSRFQLLIFTFVVALSLFVLVEKQGQFPEVTSGVLTLLGISATTYGVSKGIQAGSDLPPKGSPTDPATVAAVAAAAGAAAGAQTGAAVGAAAGAQTGAQTGAAAGAVTGAVAGSATGQNNPDQNS